MISPRELTDISIRSKVVRGVQKIEIRSRDLGHAHLGVVLSFRGRFSRELIVCRTSMTLIGGLNSGLSQTVKMLQWTVLVDSW